MNRKMLKEENIQKFDRQIYLKISLNDLVVFTVYFLSQLGNEIITEDIVAGCFLLFPERFALRGYPQWPDASVVTKRWIDCRNKDWIVGSTARGISLTPKGLAIAEKIYKTLTGKRPLILRTKTSKDTRSRADRFIQAIISSDAYKIFLDGGKEAKMSEFDFRSMLMCTMDSSAHTLRNNLEQFKQYVSSRERKDLLEFLDCLARKFKNILFDATKDQGKYKGGMLRQKIK